MSKKLLIQQGKLINPANKTAGIFDILIQDNKIKEISNFIEPNETFEIIDARNKIVVPGFIDLHCHLREPGQEFKETVATGTMAAAAGGFTTVCAMPNTFPTIDSKPILESLTNLSKATGVIRVLPIAAATIKSEGKTLTEMFELVDAGAIGFSDDGKPIYDPFIMRQALNFSAQLKVPIINHCEVLELSKNGVMNESWVSTQLGLPGIPNSAEESMVSRDILLSKLTGGHIHIAHVSTSGSVNLIRQAKKEGVNITCEVTPHHLTLTDRIILNKDVSNQDFVISNDSYDTRAKVNPPLRTSSDVESLIEALNDGTIDMIATDHAPHSDVDKICTFSEAAFGISNIETAFSSIYQLVLNNQISLTKLIESLTIGPAKILGPQYGNLDQGNLADITIIDLNEQWKVNPAEFLSKGKNSPIDGSILTSKVVKTIYQGKIVI
ncbi:MAG: dihydroorotase [Dehalococcoidia bacterium]